MISCYPQKRAAVLESRDLNQPKVPEHGGSGGHYSQDGSAKESARTTAEATRSAAKPQTPVPATTGSSAPWHSSRGSRPRERFDDGLHSAHGGAFRGLVVRRHPDHGVPHHRQHAADGEPP